VLEGAVTAGYQADREKVIALLNEALATELVCVLRYKQHYFLARGIQAEPVAQEFAEHAAEEQGHADRIAQRITQLGGEPGLQSVRAGLPERLGVRRRRLACADDRGQPRRRADRDRHLPRGDQFVGEKDSTTRRMLEDILAVEESTPTNWPICWRRSTHAPAPGPATEDQPSSEA
jgi:bacterioferritin